MHELSLAVNAVEICLENSNGQKIKKVTIEYGDFSGVDRHAFEFAWPEAIKNTSLIESQLELIQIKGLLKCKICHHDFESSDLVTFCPQCESFDLSITRGREFRVASMEVENVS